MAMQSTLRRWAKTAGCLGIVLLPLETVAADTASKAIAVQPINTIKPVMAPPVALPKPDLPPVVTRPLTPAPIVIQPVRTDPVRIGRPEVSPPPGAIKPPLNPLPLNPVSRSDGPAGDGVPPGVSAARIEYQKQTNKEAREDRRLSKESKQLSQEAKREKLKLDNENIRAGRDEASKKADNAMDAAHVEMVTGVVSSGQQAGAVAGSVGGKTAGAVKSDLRQQVREVKDANARKKALRDSGKTADESQGTDGGKGDKTIVASPKTASGTAPPKTSLISRPCTPINPC